MIDRLLSSPLIAFGFLVFVFFLILMYLTQKERAKVARMRGPRRFQPRWSSGRKHRGRRRLSSRQGDFKPHWNREKRRRSGAPKPQPDSNPGKPEAED